MRSHLNIPPNQFRGQQSSEDDSRLKAPEMERHPSRDLQESATRELLPETEPKAKGFIDSCQRDSQSACGRRVN